MDLTNLFFLVPAIALVLLIAGRSVSSPRIALRAALNSLLGLGALLLVNLTGSAPDLAPGLNLFNAAVVAILGVPGLGLLFLAQWVLT